MVSNRINFHPAFILHTKAYRESSLLISLLTHHHGRIFAIARRVRTLHSKLRGVIAPFNHLLVSLGGKSELYTLYNAEIYGQQYNILQANIFYGFYLNELVTKLVPCHIIFPQIYQDYLYTISFLAKTKHPEIYLRLFEKSLLIHLGYGLELRYTITNAPILEHKYYKYEFGNGFKDTKDFGDNVFLGKNLLLLHINNLSSYSAQDSAKRLLRIAINGILKNNNKIKSIDLINR